MTIFLFVFTVTLTCQAEDVSVKTIETIQKSVVPVVCLKPTGKGNEAKVEKILGTAFFINTKGHILTAAHVVLGLKPTCGPDSLWAIYVPAGSWRTREVVRTHWFRFDECRYNEATDVAVAG
jgi:hypothetical protein